MSGNIYQFGLTTLPQHTPRWNVSTPARKNLLKTLGGVYDPSSSDTAELDLPYTITVSALAYATTAALMGASLDDYRALLGKRDRLWMHPYDTDQVDRWCWARLADINYVGAYNNRITQPVDLVFQALSGWNGHAYGGAWNLDAGYSFDNGLYFDVTGATVMNAFTEVITLANAGNRTVTNCGISVFGAGKPVTSVRVVTNLCDWTWAGTLTASDVLAIDCGKRSVLNDGAGAYSGFALGANHASPYWLTIAPGGETAMVTMAWSGVGTNPSIQFTYSDGWV